MKGVSSWHGRDLYPEGPISVDYLGWKSRGEKGLRRMKGIGCPIRKKESRFEGDKKGV